MRPRGGQGLVRFHLLPPYMSLLSFSEVLNFIWTGTESQGDYQTMFWWVGYSRYSDPSIVEQWRALCSLSQTSSLFRSLCLPKMMGTVFLGSCGTIGRLWKAIQLNPSLGSHTHTLLVKYAPRLWPYALTPSQAMGRMFKERDMKEELEKLEREDPDNDYARYMMRDRVGTLGLMALDSTRTSQVQKISRRLF